MIQLNFLNAVVEDDGHGLIVNGKELRDIISMSLGAIKKVPGRYEYLGDENKGKPFKSRLCNVSVTIDDRSADITETITCYGLGLGIDYILFFYEDRNFCSKKPYLWKITDEMKEEVKGKISCTV